MLRDSVCARFWQRLPLVPAVQSLTMGARAFAALRKGEALALTAS
jgi:hypothetical protein